MNHHTRLQKLEDAHRQNEPLRLHLLFADELAPGEQPALTLIWPEDEQHRPPRPPRSAAQEHAF